MTLDGEFETLAATKAPFGTTVNFEKHKLRKTNKLSALVLAKDKARCQNHSIRQES